MALLLPAGRSALQPFQRQCRFDLGKILSQQFLQKGNDPCCSSQNPERESGGVDGSYVYPLWSTFS